MTNKILTAKIATYNSLLARGKWGQKRYDEMMATLAIPATPPVATAPTGYPFDPTFDLYKAYPDFDQHKAASKAERARLSKTLKKGQPVYHKTGQYLGTYVKCGYHHASCMHQVIVQREGETYQQMIDTCEIAA